MDRSSIIKQVGLSSDDKRLQQIPWQKIENEADEYASLLLVLSEYTESIAMRLHQFKAACGHKVQVLTVNEFIEKKVLAFLDQTQIIHETSLDAAVIDLYFIDKNALHSLHQNIIKTWNLTHDPTLMCPAADPLGFASFAKDIGAEIFHPRGTQTYVEYTLESNLYKAPMKVVVRARSLGEVYLAEVKQCLAKREYSAMSAIVQAAALMGDALHSFIMQTPPVCESNTPVVQKPGKESGVFPRSVTATAQAAVSESLGSDDMAATMAISMETFRASRK